MKITADPNIEVADHGEPTPSGWSSTQLLIPSVQGTLWIRTEGDKLIKARGTGS